MVQTNYWWQLIWLFLFGGVSFAFIPKREEVVLGKPVQRWGKLSAAALMLPYVIWAALRTDVYGDTGQYRATFQGMPTGLSHFWPYLQTQHKGPAFAAFRYLFKSFFSESAVAYFFVVALIQAILLIYFFRRYSKNYWLSIFFFVASTDYMSWMHNGIRQFLAVTIIMACVPLIIQKKPFAMCLVVLLCALIHSSALIFLPFVFVINGKAYNGRTLLFIFGLIISIVFIDKVTGFIVRSMEDTAYAGDIDIFLKDDGTNIFRVLFYSVPAVLAWIFRERIDNAEDPMINLCANLSVVTAGVYVFSYFTSGILVGALPIYFSLANYILIPWLLDEVFNKESALLLKGGFVAVYSFFFYYQMGVAWRLL